MNNTTTAQKREVISKTRKGLGVAELMLIAILLAAGAVLKFFVGQIINFGMKPNFIIAMYCLIVLLLKPRVLEAAVIGLLAGAVCQFFPGTPFINMVSELIGAVAMALLIRIPLGTLNPTAAMIIKTPIATFISTLFSGFSFIGCQYLMFYAGQDITPTPLVAFMAIIFGTATINAIIVTVLYPPLKKVLKK